MVYSVYRVNNTLNGKYYIGVHKTENPNDLYFGSGKAILAAIKKYGKACFEKQILLITEDKEEAYIEERRLTENYNSNNTYNLRLGGVGGFSKQDQEKGYINGISKFDAFYRKELGKKNYPKNLAIQDHVANGRKGGLNNKGKPKSAEHIQKIKDSLRKKYGSKV